MPEAVQFYWNGGEATLPLDVVPPEDRNPLRVRRAVVEVHAPEVINQLRSGRYVAAAWSADDQIAVIICHPNIVKKSPDTVLVTPSYLPRLTLNRGRWDEAPAFARLILKAFGSDAAPVEEVNAARHALWESLSTRGQPEWLASIWRHLLVKGQKEQIDEFMMEVGKRFDEQGWSRQSSYEALYNRDPHQINRFYCWVSRQEKAPHILLCLNRATDRRVRGGTYDILEREGSFVELASQIQRALTEIIGPAAGETGVIITYPRLGPISRVGPRTTGELTALAEAADGRWPLPIDLEALWKRFVVTAVHENVAINPDELIAWFVANSWRASDATQIANQFYFDAAMIGEYEEAGRQPA